jgi:hypothetical protein
MMSLLQKSVISPNKKTAYRNYPIKAASISCFPLSLVIGTLPETFSVSKNYESSIF